MNAFTSLLKNSDRCCDKKFDLVQKNQIYFCTCKKKKVFGIEKSDLYLLNKTKSFCFKKKILDFFLRTRKIGFGLFKKKKKSNLFYNKKVRFVEC